MTTLGRLLGRSIAIGLAFCGAAHAQVEIPILLKPVPISASYDPGMVMLTGECHHFEPTYRIATRGQALIVKPGFLHFCQESIDVALRKAVNVYGPFITFRGSCGGNVWSCEERALYTFTGEEVVGLGRIDDYLFAFGKTLFLKYFDWYEVNDFTGHSGKEIRIVLSVSDRRLVLDPELTWVLNHDMIELNKWKPSRDGCGRDQEASNQVDCLEQLIYTLQLAKLTGRASLYKESITLAQRKLDAVTFESIRKMAEAITNESVQKWLDAGRR